MPFFPSKKAGALSPKARCVGTLSLHARSAIDVVSLHARCIDALSLHERCASGVSREKNEASRLFSNVYEVEDHPYHLGEVAFGSLTYGEDPLNPSS